MKKDWKKIRVIYSTTFANESGYEKPKVQVIYSTRDTNFSIN